MDEVRDKVMDLLATYYARGALELEEYERRVEAAARGQSRADLEAVLGSLPALPPASPSALPTRETTPTGAAAQAPMTFQAEGEVRPTQTLASVFSSVTRRGEWSPARRTQAVAFFGSTDLDLRQARLPPGVTSITAVAFFGSVSILVPPGVNVEMNGVGIFGAFDSNVPENRGKGVPTLRVDGVALFGSASVRFKRPKP